MADLAPVSAKLAPLVRLLGSNMDGEALGAVRAMRRVLAGVNADFNDLAERIEHDAAPKAIQPRQSGRPYFWEVRTLLQEGIARRLFTSWEGDFAVSVLSAIERQHAAWQASPRQQAVLDRLLGKARDAGVRP